VTAGLAERAAAIVEGLPVPPTPEAVLAAQDEVEALAERAKGDDLAGVQDAGHMLAMIADFVLDPAARPPGEALVAAAAWREADHPRIPGGKGGGEFTHAPGGGIQHLPGLREDMGAWSDEDLAGLDALVEWDEVKGRGDPALSAICERQGFNALPQRGDLDAAEKAGGRRIYRGLKGKAYTDPDEYARTQRQYADDFLSKREGRRLGFGIYGNGDYFSPKRETALVYSEDEPSAVVEAVLPASARVADGAELEAEWQRLQWAKDRHGGKTPATAFPGSKVTNDPGRYAALLGYDAVSFGPEGQVIVLNRGALVVAP
jgi:hypothetical protein